MDEHSTCQPQVILGEETEPTHATIHYQSSPSAPEFSQVSVIIVIVADCYCL
jgi:hypothetical protein